MKRFQDKETLGQRLLYRLGTKNADEAAWKPPTEVRKAGARRLLLGVAASAIAVPAILGLHSGPDDATLNRNSVAYDVGNKADNMANNPDLFVDVNPHLPGVQLQQPNTEVATASHTAPR